MLQIVDQSTPIEHRSLPGLESHHRCCYMHAIMLGLGSSCVEERRIVSIIDSTHSEFVLQAVRCLHLSRDWLAGPPSSLTYLLSRTPTRCPSQTCLALPYLSLLDTPLQCHQSVLILSSLGCPSPNPRFAYRFAIICASYLVQRRTSVGVLGVLGGALCHLVLGTTYCWGNFVPYVPAK